MFRATQFIVRHKIGFVAVVATGVFMFGRGGEQKAVKPWDSDAAQASVVQANTSIADKAIGVAAGAAKQYAGVDVYKVLPGTLRKDTVDNWQATGDAVKRANRN